MRPSLRFVVRVTHHLSRPRHERRGRADDTNATRGRRGPRTDTHSRWHLHPRAHGPGATPTLSPRLCRGADTPRSDRSFPVEADAPCFVHSLSLEQIHPLSIGAWPSPADTPRFPLFQADDGSVENRNGLRGTSSLLSRALLPRLRRMVASEPDARPSRPRPRKRLGRQPSMDVQNLGMKGQCRDKTYRGVSGRMPAPFLVPMQPFPNLASAIHHWLELSKQIPCNSSTSIE